MDPEEKRRISNEKRLQAVKNWKKKGFLQNNVQNKRVVYFEDSSVKELPKASSKLKLFGSDDEEDNYENDFRIRPQFQSSRGQKLLEMSSKMSDRFKLDERFKEGDEPQLEEGEDDERKKSIRLLEKVLGHEVLLRGSSGSSSNFRNKHVRFDPEDENASKYIKSNKQVDEPRKKRSKKEAKEKPPEVPLPKSEERYIEVTSNLKDILHSSTPFSLSEKFNIDEKVDSLDIKAFGDFSKQVQGESYSKTRIEQKDRSARSTNSKYFPPRFKSSFFMSENDIRLKEGVEFFCRKKPLNEIKEEWNKKRELVLELFRKKKKSVNRSHRGQTQQRKYKIRNQQK